MSAAARVSPGGSGFTGSSVEPEKEKMMDMTECETCTYYTYDEEYDEYVCDAYMDEDDYARLISDIRQACPYYRDKDEYKVVRHQM